MSFPDKTFVFEQGGQMEDNISLRDQAQRIKEIAEKSGVQSNFLFVTTFDRYLTQLEILENLKESISAEGLLVEKEYVKNRKNLYSNPAVSEYNRTVDSANKTVSTLMRIIRNFNVSEDEETEDDPLMKALRGE